MAITAKTPVGCCPTAPSQDVPNTPQTSYSRGQKIILGLSLFALFMTHTCASLPAPFLPALDESHNIDSGITGWVIGMQSLIQLIVCPLFGKLLAYVARKNMFITGLSVSGLLTATFGMLEYLPLPDANDDSMDTLYLTVEIGTRILQSLGAGCIVVASMTFLSTTFMDTTTTVMGYAQTATGLGWIVGPAIGSGLYELGGFACIFVTMGACMLLMAVAGLVLLPGDEVRRSNETGKVSPKTILCNKRRVGALAIAAITASIWACILPVLEPELREKYGLEEEISALTFLLIALTFTVTTPIIATLLDKMVWLKATDLVLCGFLLNGFNFLLLGPCPLFVGFIRPLWLALLCLAIMGLGIALGTVPSLDLLYSTNSKNVEIDRADISSRALLSAFWSSAYAFGDFMGPTVSGIMAANVTFGWTMTAFAAVCFVGTICVILFKAYSLLTKQPTSQTDGKLIEEDESTPLLS